MAYQHRKDYIIGAAPSSYSSCFYPYRHESEWARIEPMTFGFAYVNEPAKPLFPTRLTESNESITIDLVYVLQDEWYVSVGWM